MLFGPNSPVYEGKYGVVLTLPLNAETLVRGIQEQFHGNLISFPMRPSQLRKPLSSEVLPGVKSIPHLVLFSSIFKQMPHRVVTDALHTIARNRDRAFIEMRNFRISHNAFVYWDVEKTLTLLEVHRTTFGKLSPYVDRQKVSKESAPGMYTSEQKRNFLLHGTPYVEREWCPQVLVAHQEKPEIPEDVLSVEYAVEGYSPQIAFCKMGSMGAVEEIVYQVHLNALG